MTTRYFYDYYYYYATLLLTLPLGRFNAMLCDLYGGRKAIREVIRSGRLFGVLLGAEHRPEEQSNRGFPARKPRWKKAKRAAMRSRYFGTLAEQMQSQPDTVKRRRVARIMKKREEYYAEGMVWNYTTHVWSQHHLRNAGVKLPPVVWPKLEAKGKGKHCSSSSTAWQ